MWQSRKRYLPCERKNIFRSEVAALIVQKRSESFKRQGRTNLLFLGMNCQRAGLKRPRSRVGKLLASLDHSPRQGKGSPGCSSSAVVTSSTAVYRRLGC